MRLLCVTAHPDDEAGGFGGTLLHYAQRGIETHILCLTPGQAATNRGGAKSDDELAAMRRKEFAASCKILKVSHGEVLDYPDARLYRLDFYAVVEDLVRRLRSIRPQVVITMGPEGSITAHPDHSMVSIFATMAYHWAGRSNRFPEQLKQGLDVHQTQKLYYLTATFTIPERPPVLLPPITATIDAAEFLEAKISAFKAHSSQAPLFARVESTVRQRGGKEHFHLAAAAKPGLVEQETDLFHGVSE
ncbi:MAG TPA: PIG-L family deacetylase [Terriglobales bacterium]|nr:PIG-L family deacetylase [Terriglobales bacterium]